MSISADTEPRWVRDVVLTWRRDASLFATTALRFLRNPRQFGAEWADGRLDSMNPLLFLALSWPILLPLDYGLQELLRTTGAHRPQVSLMVEIARALRPYLLVIPTSVLVFSVLRLAGSRRRFSTTVGLLLYWICWVAFVWILGLFASLLLHAPAALTWALSFLALPWGALALAGAHAIRWGWCLIVFVPSCLISIKVVNAALRWVGWS